MDKITGSMETLSAMQVTADIEGLDAECKAILVVIRLGDKVYNGKEGDEGYGLFRFLNAVMYPHREDFMDTISEYIDFSGNEELWKEAEHMVGLGQSILEEGIEQGIEAFILDNLEEGIPKERILAKLQRRFRLSQERAERYYVKFVAGE